MLNNNKENIIENFQNNDENNENNNEINDEMNDKINNQINNESNNGINDSENNIESFDNNELKKQKIKKLLSMREKIQQLNKDEYYEIFKIIKEEDENYSSNKNGIMFDLLKIKQSTVDRISGFLKYSQEKNRQINNDEFNRDKYKELLS